MTRPREPRPSTWLRYPPHAHRELPDRTERYTEPRPLSRSDIRELLYMLPAAAFVVAGLIAYCVLVFTLVPGPR